MSMKVESIHLYISLPSENNRRRWRNKRNQVTFINCVCEWIDVAAISGKPKNKRALQALIANELC